MKLVHIKRIAFFKLIIKIIADKQITMRELQDFARSFYWNSCLTDGGEGSMIRLV